MTDQTATEPAPIEEPQTIRLSHPDTDLVREVRPEDLPTWRTQGWREVKDEEPANVPAPAETPQPPAQTAPAAEAETKRRSRNPQTTTAPVDANN